MKSSLKPILGFVLAGIIVIFLHAKLGLWTYEIDTCKIFSRTSRIVYQGECLPAGDPYYGDFSLGPLAEYIFALPIFIFKKVEAAYLFASVLWLISVILFFIVIKRYFDHRVAFWATLAYLFSPSIIHLQVMPWNDSPLPIFLPAYYYSLMEGRYRKNYRLLTYILIGFMAQLHIITLTLIPTSWVFWRLSGDTRASFLLHTAGFVAIFILHLPLVFHYISLGIEPIKDTLSVTNVIQAHKGNFYTTLLYYFAAPILMVFLSVPFLIILAPISLMRLKSFSIKTKRSALINLISLSTCLFLCSLIATTFKGELTDYHLNCSIPFSITLAGILLNAVFESKKATGKIAVGFSILLSSLLLILGQHIWHPYASIRSLEANLWFAKRFSNWLNTNNIYVERLEEYPIARGPLFFKDLVLSEEHPDFCIPSLIELSGLKIPDKGEPKSIKIIELKKQEENDWHLDLSNCPERWEYKGVVFYVCTSPSKEGIGTSIEAEKGYRR